MSTISVTIPEELEAELEKFFQEYGERDLDSVIQDALRQYLPEPRFWKGHPYRPARKRPFRITPAEVGSGYSDVSINHDKYIAEAIEQRAFSERDVPDDPE